MPWQAIAEHQANHAPAIRFERGEVITVAHRDARFPGWWWCIDKHGRGGWVHERFFEEDDYRFVGREDFDGHELTVSPGEQVEVLEICEGGRCVETQPARSVGCRSTFSQRGAEAQRLGTSRARLHAGAAPSSTTYSLAPRLTGNGLLHPKVGHSPPARSR